MSPRRYRQNPAWHDVCLRELAAERNVNVIVRGTSLEPRIKDGDTVRLVPALGHPGNVGDAVFARLRRDRFLIHLVIDRDGDLFLIGNARGGTDGWIHRDAILGVVTEIGVAPGFVGVTVDERPTAGR